MCAEKFRFCKTNVSRPKTHLKEGTVSRYKKWGRTMFLNTEWKCALIRVEYQAPALFMQRVEQNREGVGVEFQSDKMSTLLVFLE
jgi:hypothetical protein